MSGRTLTALVVIIGLCAACRSAEPTALPVTETSLPGLSGLHTAVPATATVAHLSTLQETDTAIPPTHTPARAPVTPMGTPEPAVAPPMAATPLPPVCSAGRGALENGSFDHDGTHWDVPCGTLSHSASEYLSAPGAAQLVTSHSSDSLKRLATFGQCIDLRATLDHWLESDGAKQMTVEAHLRTDVGIATASLSAVLLGGTKCRGEHVAKVYPAPVSGGGLDQGVRYGCRSGHSEVTPRLHMDNRGERFRYSLR